MASVRGCFEYPDGLTPGQSKDGGLHQNLYDDDKNLVGHGRFIPDDEEDSSAEAPPFFFSTNECDCESESRERLDPEELLEDLITLINFAMWTAPHLKRWWTGQARPFIKSTRSRLARTRKGGSPDTPNKSTTLVDSVSTKPSQEATTELEEDRVSMSSEEASARFGAALLARLFSDDQMRTLRNARIKRDRGSSDLSAVENLTPQQVREGVRLAIEANPSLLTKEFLGELQQFLAKTQGVDGHLAIEQQVNQKAIGSD